jgi:hypothetical protein
VSCDRLRAMARQQTDRERIADALYMLAAGADQAVLMDTLRAFVVAHSKEEADVSALLKELPEAQPTLTVTAIKGIANKAPVDDELRAIIDSDVSVRVVKVAKAKQPHKPGMRRSASKAATRKNAERTGKPLR